MSAPVLPTHPAIEYALDCEFTITGETAKRLIEYAERYRREPVALLADLILKVLDEDLVDAVLDESPAPSPTSNNPGGAR
jgi:hypothetical protein